VVEEHAEEQPAEQADESQDLADTSSMELEAPAEVADDASPEDELQLDPAPPEESDQEQVTPEMDQTEDEEVAEVEAVLDSEEDSSETEDDPDAAAEDSQEDTAVEDDEAQEVGAEDADLPEDSEAVEVEAEVQDEAEDESVAEADEDTETVAAAEEPEQVPDDDRNWYVVHCYSGYENKVRHNLEQRIETMGMKNKIFDVVVPTEEEIEVKDGKRRTVERRVFPGYILVQMLMDEDSWYVVRNTPGVTGFVGMGNEPTPLRQEEVAQIVKRMEAEAPRIKVAYKTGQKVRIIDGPFNDFIGTVSVIDMERAKVRVMVSFFGRETPVELDFLQVEKA
jgi:transcriptional antiterminator NusG